MKKIFVYIVKKISPPSFHLSFLFYYNKYKGRVDPEMHYIESLLDNRRRFVDIGANVGFYSYHFSKSFDYVDAFEPISEITCRLSFLNRKNLKIHSVALSNTIGMLHFYIPIINTAIRPALASLEPRAKPHEDRVVEVKKLDDYKFNDVDLIKIDVEGHEFNVIEGAIETIKNSFPILLVEIEQRHTKKPIDDIFNLILQIGYDGYFLDRDELISIDKFSYKNNQKPFLNHISGGQYINNFIFIHHSKNCQEKKFIVKKYVI